MSTRSGEGGTVGSAGNGAARNGLSDRAGRAGTVAASRDETGRARVAGDSRVVLAGRDMSRQCGGDKVSRVGSVRFVETWDGRSERRETARPVGPIWVGVAGLG